MEALGHEVRKVPQDIWREYVRGDNDPNWVDKLPIKADINIICKWHHFYDRSFVDKLREVSGAPVFYWVWDYMNDQGVPQWHLDMVRAADLYLGNDVRDPVYNIGKPYYFPFDVTDRYITPQMKNKIYDVSFFGSWIGQGDRQVWLKEINKTNPITVFSWNYQEWPEEFDARPAVYGDSFAEEVAKSKIILGFSVEPNTWGYWSNRVGKVLALGGFLLQQYAPGMELFLRDGAEYFSSIEEARDKIDHYLIADEERARVAEKGFIIGQDRLTSRERVKDLMILAERYLKSHDGWKF